MPIEPLPPGPLAGFVLDDGRYRRIEVPGATQTLAFGIDDAGRIAGGYEDAASRIHGFVRDDDGEIHTINVPGAYATIVTRTNAAARSSATTSRRRRSSNRAQARLHARSRPVHQDRRPRHPGIARGDRRRRSLDQPLAVR